MLLAFVPASPNWTLDPQLALALFVAPVLLDAAYDTSLRELRANWRPVAGLAIAAVIRRMSLTDDDPVGREIRLGRTYAYGALLDAIKDDDTLSGKLLRKEYGAVVELNAGQASDAPVDEV